MTPNHQNLDCDQDFFRKGIDMYTPSQESGVFIRGDWKSKKIEKDQNAVILCFNNKVNEV